MLSSINYMSLAQALSWIKGGSKDTKHSFEVVQLSNFFVNEIKTSFNDRLVKTDPNKRWKMNCTSYSKMYKLLDHPPFEKDALGTIEKKIIRYLKKHFDNELEFNVKLVCIKQNCGVQYMVYKLVICWKY